MTTGEINPDVPMDNKLYRNFLNSGQKRQHSFIRRQAVDVQFSNISYDVTCWSLRKKPETKRILDGVCGKFNSGELSAVMGPSGAGKSSLLNILAGYRRRGVTGQVFINGRERSNQNLRSLSKLSCYLQQEDALRPTLTTLEIMNITINLKLGDVSTEKKQDQIEELLVTLGLTEARSTMCSRLSGGQKKRLAIALELISNPPVIFLDEPTTGLDSSSTSQCVSMLKFLAHQGRTIICTIHQPSALLFEMFDQLYTIAEGKCIYQGSIKGLLPHLNSFGLVCPKFHNPADFVLDVAVGEYGADVEVLKEAAKKQLQQRGGIFSEKASFIKGSADTPEVVIKDKMQENNEVEKIAENIPGPASLSMQFYLLLLRNLIDIKRKPYLYIIRLLAHAIIGVVFGYLYYNVGATAHTVLANTVYVYGTNLFLVYTGKMSVTMSMPTEITLLDREYFNRHFSLAPYYFAKILIEMPFQLLSAYVYLTISYYLTGQPYEWRTMIFVYIFCGLNSLCAQSFGLFIGTTVPVTVAVFVGPVSAVILSMFGFNIFYRDTNYYFRWLFHISYFRAGYHGMMTVLYNDERGLLPCPEELVYCHFRLPSKFLENVDIMNVDIYGNIGYILSLGVVMYIITYIAIWLKLHRR